MLKQYLKSGLRYFRKNKGFSLINVTGLSLGLASMMALAMLVQQYYTTDKFHEKADRIYYLKTFIPDGYSYNSTTFPLLYEIQKACPEVEAATHWQGFNAPWLTYGEVEVQDNTIFVDTGFFEVFTFSLKEGHPDFALLEKHSVVISQKIATQLFGQEKALGKMITASDSLRLTVTGVLNEIPENSSLKAEIILPVELLTDNPEFGEWADWYNTFAENYLLLREGADPKLLDQKIDKIVKQFYASEHQQHKVKTVSLSQLKKEGDPVISAIITGAVASAFFIGLIILVNLLNLNTAMMFSRTKEVAIRRVIGSGKDGIIFQFCIENALIIFSSLVLGFLLFTQLLLPQINRIIGDSFGNILFEWQEDYLITALFISVALIFSILAGSMPAWFLSQVKVSEGVKGNFIRTNSQGGIRSIFITIQFALAVVLIAVSIILNSQIRFMKRADPGYNSEEVAVVKLDLAYKNQKKAETQFERILQKLKNNPYVKEISTTPGIPTAYWDNFNRYSDPESNKEVHMRQAGSDAGFVGTYEIPIIEGRNFDDQQASAETKKVIINETAAKAFGWQDPIGKQIKSKGSDEVVEVIGVMADFHYNSLQQPIEPLLHRYSGKPSISYNQYLSIRMDPKHSHQILGGLERDFMGMESRRPFSYEFMGERTEKQYALMDGLLKVSNFVALLTIFIAVMGLFGLVALFSRQRIKEIGIRKVLGAGILDITTLLSKDFLKLVLIAVFLATPLAWIIMHKWLEDFAYRIQISGWYFAAAGFMALFIAMLTVSIQSIKAAKANPVKSLRTE